MGGIRKPKPAHRRYGGKAKPGIPDNHMHLRTRPGPCAWKGAQMRAVSGRGTNTSHPARDAREAASITLYGLAAALPCHAEIL